MDKHSHINTTHIHASTRPWKIKLIAPLILLVILIVFGGCNAREEEDIANITSLPMKTPVPNTFGLNQFQELLMRVWLTEYNDDKPADIARGRFRWVFCEDEIQTLDGKKVEFPLPDYAKNISGLLWPYECSPIRFNLSHIEANTKKETYILLEMLYFPGVSNVLPTVLDMVKKNRLGKYKFSKRIYSEINEIRLRKKLATVEQSNVKVLEMMHWEDTLTEYPSPINFDYELKRNTLAKNRILMLSWDGVVHSKRDGYVSLKLGVPENFFQGFSGWAAEYRKNELIN